MQWSAEPEPPPPPPQRERRPRAADPLAGLAEELSRVPAAAPEPSGVEPAPRQPLLRREPRAAPRPQPAAAPAPAPEAQFSSSADQNLAEMAQRLEAALRRPAAKPDDASRAPQPAPKAAAQPAPEPMHDEIEGEPPPPAPRAPATPRGDARPARADAKPAPQKSLYDSLEQEMASLLGRPNNKP